MRKGFGWLFGLVMFALVGCSGSTGLRPDASLEAVSRAAYHHDGPAELTLFTMINNRSGAGAHTSLMINGSQRVIFDPAGTVRLSAVPERGDVLYGVTPTVAEFYARAHAREAFHVVVQTVEVAPDVAEQALRLAVAQGFVGQARCALTTSGILQQLPGFESVGNTWFPKRLMTDFAELPGVRTTKIFETDDNDKSVAIAQYEQTLADQ